MDPSLFGLYLTTAKDPEVRWSTAAELATGLSEAITARAIADERRHEARRRWVLRAGSLFLAVARRPSVPRVVERLGLPLQQGHPG